MVQGLNRDLLLVERLENQLQRSLRPVKPDPVFIGNLQNRLSSPSELVIERRQNTALGMILLAVSLLSGFLLVLVLRQNRSGSEPSGDGETPVLDQPELAF